MWAVRELSEDPRGPLMRLLTGLPKVMKLKLLEPLRELFKDGMILDCAFLDVTLADNFSEGKNPKNRSIDYKVNTSNSAGARNETRNSRGIGVETTITRPRPCYQVCVE